MLYQVWEWDGRYIRGRKVAAACKSLKTALKQAKKIERYAKLTKTTESPTLFWIEDSENNPIGLIEVLE